MTKEEIMLECYRLYLQGVTTDELAKKFGVRVDTIRSYLRKVDKNYAIKRIDETKRLVLELHNNNLYPSDIAKTLKITRSKVYRYLREAGIVPNENRERISKLFKSATQKQCICCLEIKDRTEFLVSKSGIDGHRAECKVCFKIKQKKRYADNKEKIKPKIREQNRQYQKGRRRKYPIALRSYYLNYTEI